MATCVRCGREMPSFSFGETNNPCPNCRQLAVASYPGAPTSQPPAVVGAVKRAPYRPPVTVTIVAVNLLIFTAMVATGTPLFKPTPFQVLKWGANWGPMSLDGQPWRMLTANYVHIGLLHLLVNVWGLWQIGRLSERIFGRWTYALTYTACGIAGSLASLWWHPLVVGAGASGALFGIVGALIGTLYLGKVPLPQAAREGLLKNLVGVVAINLYLGASFAGIDNSAHIGGLLTGLALGAVLGPQLMESPDRRRGHERMTFVAAALVLVAFGTYVKQNNGYVVALGNPGQVSKVQLDQAIATLQASVARDPRNKTALGLLANAYLQKKDYPNAESTLKRVLQLDPDNTAAKYNLGLVYAALSRYEEARQIFADLVQQDPKDDDTWVLLGASLDGLGREPEAVDAYQKAIALNPKNAEAYRELGLAQMKLNHPSAAIASLQQSARLDPNNAETQKDLGDVYTTMGSPAEAAAAFRKAEEMKKAASQPATNKP
jgi:membrane associated rhomboid family serine protease/Flp pilus assembly protein TadD